MVVVSGSFLQNQNTIESSFTISYILINTISIWKDSKSHEQELSAIQLSMEDKVHLLSSMASWALSSTLDSADEFAAFGAPKWLKRSVPAAQTGARMLENLGYEDIWRDI